MEELQQLKKEWQEFKIVLCKSLKIDKFIKWLSKNRRKYGKQSNS